MKKLNLGCGTDYKKGWINLDCSKYLVNTKIDVDHDLNILPLPFKDNELDQIYAEHILEHLNSNQIYVVNLMKELYRILKPNGTLIIIYPFWNNGVAHGFGHTFVYWPKFINYFVTKETRICPTRREYVHEQYLFTLISEKYHPNNNPLYKKLSNYIVNLTKEVTWVMKKPEGNK